MQSKIGLPKKPCNGMDERAELSQRNILIITDTSPLLTLAKGDGLDSLLAAGLDTRIPDAVFNEATKSKHPDAQVIGDWVIRNSDRLTIIPTQANVERERLLEAGRKAPDYGEKAVIEAATRILERNPGIRPILLVEEKQLPGLAPLQDRVEALQTGSFLKTLEMTGRISNAQEILERAAQTGRNVTRQVHELGKPPHHALQDQLRMEPLKQYFPDQVQHFDFYRLQKDGTTSYQHRETGGKLHIDVEGQTRDRHGEAISPQKALEAAKTPQQEQEKSNGIGKNNDPGQGFGI